MNDTRAREDLRLDPTVTLLGALRPVGDVGRYYEATGVDAPTLAERHQAVEHIFRMATATGLVGPHRDDDYAVLDCCDDEGSIVEDYGIRTARGFRFLYRKLNWRLSRPT